MIRASQLERLVEVANPRLQRWETEHLQDLVETVPFAATWTVTVTPAGNRDGPYILLRGLHVVWQTGATLTLLALEPFPHHAFELT